MQTKNWLLCISSVIPAMILIVLTCILVPKLKEKTIAENIVIEESISSVGSEEEISESKFIIVLDAGHQENANTEKEPIGPGAEEMKMKVAAGTTGVKTGVRESQLNLEIALLLEEELERRGYRIIQVRRSQEVDISNKERSETANAMKANALVRIHANGSENSSVNGAQTICPSKENVYVPKEIYEPSYLLSECILNAYVEETGCKKEKVYERDDMTGLNWSEVPVTILEMGYMTNPEEDEKMQDEKYREKMIQGIANGIDDYFKQIENRSFAEDVF